jgi:hypothetical protein
LFVNLFKIDKSKHYRYNYHKKGNNSMFRLYLTNLIKSHKLTAKDKEQPSIKERRIFERYNVKDRHYSMMNDQDIFAIQNISKQGFCIEASNRSFSRLTIGDNYEFKMRYAREVYTGQGTVRWKKNSLIGFELLQNTQTIKDLFKRLIVPMKIGQSLTLVAEKKTIKELPNDIMWFNGLYDTNFFLWVTKNQKVKSWLLQSSDRFIKWDKENSLLAGKVKDYIKFEPKQAIKWMFEEEEVDYLLPSRSHIQVALDIVNSCNLPEVKEQIIDHLYED